MLLLLIFSCRQNQGTDLANSDVTIEFNGSELPQRVRINAKAMEILNEWPEYLDFDDRFNALYNASNNEDLRLITEDLVEKQKLWEASAYPETFDIAQIKSRQKVLKTYLLQLNSALEYKTDYISPTRDIVEAYNALRNQFNVTINSKLDPKLLTDE